MRKDGPLYLGRRGGDEQSARGIVVCSPDLIGHEVRHGFLPSNQTCTYYVPFC